MNFEETFSNSFSHDHKVYTYTQGFHTLYIYIYI